jgi:hypothetical protein
MMRSIGRKRFGKPGRVRETAMERFTTTAFIVLFWLPLVPTATFLVERKAKLFPTQVIWVIKLLRQFA